jgi:hypothetical protein
MSFINVLNRSTIIYGKKKEKKKKKKKEKERE